MTINNKLKLLVIASTVFVIVCTTLVLSTVPLEKYQVKPTQTVPRGTSVKLYEPILPVDVVRVFARYTYIHVEYNGSTTKHIHIKYCIDRDKSNSSFISYNVSISKWIQYDGLLGVNNSTTYSVVVEVNTSDIVNITAYIDDEQPVASEDFSSRRMQAVLYEPFREHGLRDTLYFLDLISVDGFLVSSNNYTTIYSENIVEHFDGKRVDGFKVYIYFPEHTGITVSEEYRHQHDKWTSIYGSHPTSIELNIVNLPNTSKWIITYMHVELENGVIHEYFLKDVELV